MGTPEEVRGARAGLDHSADEGPTAAVFPGLELKRPLLPESRSA